MTIGVTSDDRGDEQATIKYCFALERVVPG